MSEYYVGYDNEAVSSFAVGELITFGGGGVAELITVIDNGSAGELYVSLISGAAPVDNETIVGGTSGTTADVEASVVPVYVLKYPAKMRDDLTVALNGDIRLSGTIPTLLTTHSMKYDNEAVANFTVGEVLTFGGGGTAELIQLTDSGTTGEIFVRLISLPAPLNGETIIGADTGTTADVDGYVHNRTWTAQELHYFGRGLGDDEVSTGDDIYDIFKPDASRRSTEEIVSMLNGYNISDLVAERMYGGSITQAGGDTVYSGIDISLTVTNLDTQPLIIQNNTILTDRWKNAYNPSALKGQVRLMIKTRSGGVDIDGKRVKVRLLENGSSHFTAGTTLGVGATGISLFSSADLNNTSSLAAISLLVGASVVEGFQSIDLLNGNGAQPFIQKWATGVQTRAELYEITKYQQDRTTAGVTLHGMDSRLFVGADLNFAFDGGDGAGGFAENEILTFSNGATAALLGLDTSDDVVGNMYCQLLTGVAPSDNDTITGGTSSETAAINGTVSARTINTNFLGLFTGAGFITNFGITLDPADATKDDSFADLLGAVQTPPNNVQFDGTGFVVGEDYVVIATDAGTDFAYDELSADVGNTPGAATLTVKEVIPTSRKPAGTVRAKRADGSFDRLEYASFSGSVFTLVGTLPNAIAEDADCFITDVDKLADATTLSFTEIYSGTSRAIRVKARDGKATVTETSNATGVLGSAGGSASINRVSDE